MIATTDDLGAEQKASLELVKKRFDAAKQLHEELEKRWETWYGLSRNYHRLGSAYADATTPRDKDVVLSDIKREFGQELFIPYGFTVIETNVPRIISRSPRYRGVPTGRQNMQLNEEAKPGLVRLYERDAENMRYERKLQETVRSGLRYGLGVQKEYWRKDYREGREIGSRIFGLGRQVKNTKKVVYEGPEVESVDIFDFFWDPTAHDLQTAAYVIHRTWRSMEYVKERVDCGDWAELDLEKVKSLQTTTGRGSVWDGRLRAAGLTSYSSQTEEFEVWEYHDRERVITVLGRELVVQEARNPYLHGEFPFEIYRPTIVEHEFCGIGEIEPIAHLQWELNEMRGQRRDAAELALRRGYLYQAGTIDPELFRTGAGVLVPTFQPPQDVIMPMPFTDIPQSGWEEERSIKGDIELTTAMSEAVIGSGGEDTATGTQLVQQAAGYRIRQKAKNLSIDLLRPEARKRKALYEQHYVGNDQAQEIAVEDPTQPTGFSFLLVKPEMFGAELDIVPIDGSTEPDDPAQQKNDAAELVNSIAPFAEQLEATEVIKYVLEQHGIEDFGSWIKQGPSPEEASAHFGEQVMQSIAWAMEDKGIDPELIEQILETAHRAMESEAPPQEGQAEGAAPESVPPASNGTPEPIGAAG